MPLLDKSDARVHPGGPANCDPPNAARRRRTMGVPGAHVHPYGS